MRCAPSILLALTFSTAAFAQADRAAGTRFDVIPMERMYESARALNSINSQQHHKINDWPEMVALSMKAGQFVGYVAATIDGNKDLQECAKKNYLNDIAGKSARLFASAPPNRSHSSHLNLMIAISMVCADTK